MNGFVTIVGRKANLKSHTLKHSLENNHKQVSFEDFHILRYGYITSKFKRKISEALFIKE